jgi:hypothetical protein
VRRHLGLGRIVPQGGKEQVTGTHARRIAGRAG